EALSGSGGVGILCQDHSRTTLARADVARSWAAGVMVWRSGALEAEDVTVRETREELSEGIAHGVYAADQATLVLRRADLADSSKASLWVRSATARVEDLRASRAGRDGAGADYDGRLTITRAHLEGSAGCEVQARDRSVLELRDLTTSGDETGGLGAACVVDAAHLVLDRFALTGRAESGLYVYGTLDDPLSAVAELSDGTIRGFPVGATLLGGGHELRAVFDHVRFDDVDRVLAVE
ncbi:right-handed parallel beta-helix repeat-containing protein, partial [Myxococcota bacterium]|nr:right-handed parallel beta-helix repeat-containing protein [Myxococcota bacterium]